MVAGGIAKTLTWFTRLFQLFFSIILVGILSYMIHQYKDVGVKSPRELVVPEVFSVLAIFVSFFSILAVCFLGYTLQLVAAFLDFAIFVGYLASAGLLRHNFHTRSARNPLRNVLISLHMADGNPHRPKLFSGLVKLLGALIIIQIFLFFITTILSVFVAQKAGDRRAFREKPARSDHQVV
ncbi:hypothetical protein Q9L58_005150 [Maublancomyces gigas]|uniref:MARVEL domain-containing protein n=1 Tax=Discina gigas TaxID=1032678 RepID=A0ABR3GJH3_9PEZI